MPQNTLIVATRNSLSYGEAVADARVRAVDERQQISKDAWDGSDGLGNIFPAFWSAGRS
jgi:hypothetical protein